MTAFHTWSGLALMLGGLSVALWTVTHPWGSFAGAEVGQTGQWMLSHSFHFSGGLFGLIGLLGLVEREVRAAPTLERAAFALTFVGTVLFAATGVFTAFLWPVLAREAPAMTELHGPFFMPPHPVILATTFSFSIGYSVLAIALTRARIAAGWAAASTAAGALLLLVPPAPLSPMPWAVFPAGGVLFGAGVVGLGRAVQRGLVPASLR